MLLSLLLSLWLQLVRPSQPNKQAPTAAPSIYRAPVASALAVRSVCVPPVRVTGYPLGRGTSGSCAVLCCAVETAGRADLRANLPWARVLPRTQGRPYHIAPRLRRDSCGPPPPTSAPGLGAPSLSTSAPRLGGAYNVGPARWCTATSSWTTFCSRRVRYSCRVCRSSTPSGGRRSPLKSRFRLSAPPLPCRFPLTLL